MFHQLEKNKKKRVEEHIKDRVKRCRSGLTRCWAIATRMLKNTFRGSWEKLRNSLPERLK
jgi:hypothetical protein